jgi:molecular chaperone GrpE
MSENKNDKNNPEEILEPEIVEEIEEFDADEEDVLDDLITRLQTAEEESAKNLDGWQRSQAEFVNYRKRVERDQGRMYEEAAARVIKRFLPVLDDLDRALQNRPSDGEAGEWANGMELIYRKLQTILENEGVTTMEVEGEMFDPNLHEAISQTESPEHESGQIIEVIQQGYMIGDRVLRAALVWVAS